MSDVAANRLWLIPPSTLPKCEYPTVVLLVLHLSSHAHLLALVYLSHVGLKRGIERRPKAACHEYPNNRQANRRNYKSRGKFGKI